MRIQQSCVLTAGSDGTGKAILLKVFVKRGAGKKPL